MRSFHATPVTLARLAALLAVVLTPAVAHSQDVVIHEVYSGGGEPGASYQNDFVVLFNAGTTAVDVSQWSLQVWAGGPTWEAVPLCGSIPHGRFYLVALGSGGPFGDPVPLGDCQGNVNLPLTDGAVTLVSDPAAVPEPCPLGNPLLVDLVGYGLGATCFEGNPAASPTETTGLVRTPDPCTQTQMNATEFALIAPVILSTADTNGCNNALPAVTPIPDQIVEEGDSILVVASATDADGDAVAYSATPPLAWMTQAFGTGEFTFAPGYDVASSGAESFAITIHASDGIGEGTTGFTTHVLDVTTIANLPGATMTWTGVSPANGELVIQEPPDICLDGPMPLCHDRFYVSKGHRGDPPEDLSIYGWLSCGSKGKAFLIDVGTTEIAVRDDKGRDYRFTGTTGGPWTLVAPLDAPYELTDLGTELSFAHVRHRGFYIFDRSNARLSRIEDGRGNVHTYAYAGSLLASISDGLGRTLTYQHDGQGRVIEVGDGTRTVTYGYTGTNLTSFTDAAGKTKTYQYDLASPFPGLLTSSADASGGTPLQYQYGPGGKVVQVDLGGGALQTFQYTLDATAQTVETVVSMPDGGQQQYTHDAFGRLTDYTDPASGNTHITYDGQGRLTSVTRPSTITPLSIAYDPVSGFPSTLTLADAKTIQFTYVERKYATGRFFFPATYQAPDLGLVTWTYDSAGNLVGIQDQATQSWTIGRNGFGQPTTITNPTSGVVTNAYDGLGRLQSRNDGQGTTTFGYDTLHRLTTVTHPDASTDLFTWDPRDLLLTHTNPMSKTWVREYRDNGQLSLVRDPLQAETGYTYDSFNRLTRITDPLLGETDIAYDTSWRRASVTDPTARATGYLYDQLGRPITITHPGGAQTTLAYDADSRLTAVTNPLVHTWAYGYDSRDRLTSVTDPLLHQTSYGYDDVGRLTSVTHPLGLSQSFDYDTRGLLTSASVGPVSVGYGYTALGLLDTFTDADGNPWKRGYDTHGRATSLTDPLLRTITGTYDARGRLATVTHAEGSATFTYDAANRMTQRAFSDGTVHNYAYDDVGRLLTTEGAIRGYDTAGRVTSENGMTFTYDAAGRLLTETYGPGLLVTHGYDARGLLASVQDWTTGTTSFSRDAAGRLTRLDRPNGISSHYGYDDADRLVSLAEVGATDTLGSVTLTRDALGRVTAAERLAPSHWAPPQTTQAFTYDAASQIIGYSHDGLGRRTVDASGTYRWDGGSRADSIGRGAVTRVVRFNGLNDVVRVEEVGMDPVVLVPARTDFDGVLRRATIPAIGGIGGVSAGMPSFGGRAAEEPGAAAVRVSERLRHKNRAVSIFDYESLALPVATVKVARVEPIPMGTPTDRTYYIHTPDGSLLHAIDIAGGVVNPCWFHFDEDGNTSFLTNEAGSIVSSYAYSATGEVGSIGKQQAYPSFTFGGVDGLVQESSDGLYRSGGSLWDAPTVSAMQGPGVKDVNPAPVKVPEIVPIPPKNPWPFGHSSGGHTKGIVRVKVRGVSGSTPAVPHRIPNIPFPSPLLPPIKIDELLPIDPTPAPSPQPALPVPPIDLTPFLPPLVPILPDELPIPIPAIRGYPLRVSPSGTRPREGIAIPIRPFSPLTPPSIDPYWIIPIPFPGELDLDFRDEEEEEEDLFSNSGDRDIWR